MSDSLNVSDLTGPPPGHSFKATIEPQEGVADRYVRLFKNVVLFLVAISFVVLIVYLRIASLLSPKTPEEEKKWAMSILSAMAGGLVGYLIRK